MNIYRDLTSAEIVKFSRSMSNDRPPLVTFLVTYPRSILPEVNTHRMISKNTASSRAIPVRTMLQFIRDNPYIPTFTKNVKGMQGGEPLTGTELAIATYLWLQARDRAVEYVQEMGLDNYWIDGNGHLLAIDDDFTSGHLIEFEDGDKKELVPVYNLNIAKQDINRLLEPWMWTTMVMTASSFANLFALRFHPMAHPAFIKLAECMLEAYWECVTLSHPKISYCKPGQWHLPFVDEVDSSTLTEKESKYWASVSSGRCGGVSYGRQGIEKDPSKAISLYHRFVGGSPLHASPVEHQAKLAHLPEYRSGNFTGWHQFRHMIPNESSRVFEYKGIAIP